MADLTQLSEVLFGRAMRLPVALFVLDKPSGLVFPMEIADALGYKPSYVIQELERLEALGMVKELPKSDSRRRYFQRVDNFYWRIVQAAKLVGENAPQNMH